MTSSGMLIHGRRAASVLSSCCRSTSCLQLRGVSSQGTVAVERLRSALEDYRAINYTQSIPSRFMKDIVQAAKDDHSTDKIAIDGMQRVISNINMEHRVSRADMEAIFHEIGAQNGMVSVDKFMKMI